jgi:hypothetical protein
MNVSMIINIPLKARLRMYKLAKIAESSTARKAILNRYLNYVLNAKLKGNVYQVDLTFSI